MATDGASPLEHFAGTAGLSYSATSDLPEDGSVFGHSNGKVLGAATGALAQGLTGTVVLYEYTYSDSDNHTHTVRETVAFVRIPESIGFAPYLAYSGGITVSPLGGGEAPKKVELDTDIDLGGELYAYKGTSDGWLRQLFSPALTDWLSRSPDGFGFELCDGLLCVGRQGHLSDPAELRSLCEDTARLAGAIEAESQESAETGDTDDAAQELDSDPRVGRALEEVELASSPADVNSARSEFRGWAAARPGIWIKGLGVGLLITLILNIPAAAIPIVMLNAGNGKALFIGEAVVVLIIAFFAIRSAIRRTTNAAAEEAFYRRYAADRSLRLEGPLRFSAQHAEAGVGFKPDRVLSGPVGDVANRSLVLCGDGTDRDSKIAVVAGPKGPVAAAELKASAAGISASDLDAYAERLTKELASAA